MTAGEARAMGHDDVEVTVVTPERGPLSLFGTRASAAVAQELRRAGVGIRSGVVSRTAPGGLALRPGAGWLPTDRVIAVPRLVGPAIPGVAYDDEGFIFTGEDARVAGAERTWAAGDAVVSPVKFGGLATHQARRAAAAIARLAGATDAPDPGEPVLHGHLLVGMRSRRLAPSGDREGAPLWWPGGKLAGEHLPRWLAAHGIAPRAIGVVPYGAVPVHRSLTAMAPEAQYLHDLAREFCSDDPALARLGRRMHAASDALEIR
jgi:sulfide:quinone oxidoreductase